MRKREKISAIRILRKASNLLKEVGWCQGRFRTTEEDGKTPTAFCVIGALDEVREDRSNLHSSYALIDYLKSKYPYYISLASWNDSPDRKKREVLLALQATANRLEKTL